MNNANFQPQVQDEAMDRFRAAFAIPLTTHVVKNGNLMRMRVTNSDRAQEFLALAQTLILINQLPLMPRLSEWKVGECIFDRWLEIEFDQTQTVPECY